MATQSKPMSTDFIFLAILILILLVGHLKAQEGIGCATKTCPTPGQVRMNAVFNANGEFISGCNCAFQQIPPFNPNPVAPVVPATPVIPIQPNPNPNLPAPTNTYTATCDGRGSTRNYCGCPIGHRGPCNIICEGTPDACKDVLIECNNDGYPCTVDCLAENACASGSFINGPLDSALTVNCMGKKSCEGDTEFNGHTGTDLIVTCDGQTSCKDGIFNFGSGRSEVNCNGLPDACVSALFEFLPNSQSIPGASWQCNGVKCPGNSPPAYGNGGGGGGVVIPPVGGGSVPIPAPVPVPVPVPVVTAIPTTKRPTFAPTTSSPTQSPTTKSPTLSPTRAPTKTPTDEPSMSPTKSPTRAPTVEPTKCEIEGDCQCNHGMAQPCIIECNGSGTACKNSLITCQDGQDCYVDCVATESCSGDAVIVGPMNAALTVNCIGDKSCQGTASIEGMSGTDVTVVCSGNEACKGSGVSFNFGSGIGSVFCSGKPDACRDTHFNLPVSSVAFQCVGTNCPAEPAGFNHGLEPLPAAPGLKPGETVLVDPTQNTRTPILVTPPLTYPIGGGGGAGTGVNPNPYSPYCCRTRFLDFTLWKGQCWGQTSVIGCLSVANSRCVWDATDCLPDPPVNGYGRQCGFQFAACTTNEECCSETCIAGVGCR